MILKTYRRKLIAILVLIAIIPIALVGVSLALRIKNHIIDEGIRQRGLFVKGEGDKFDIWLKDKEDVLISVSENYPYLKQMMNSKDSFTNVSNYLNGQIRTSQTFFNLYITLKDGRTFNSSNKELETDTREREWYQQALKKEGTIWTEPYEDLLTGENVITVATPLYDEMGQFQGVIGGDFSLNQIMKYLDEVNIENSTTYIINSKGQIINTFGEDLFAKYRDGYSDNINNFIKKIVEDNFNHGYISLDQEYIAVYSTIPTLEWSIVSLISKESLYRSLVDVYIFTLYTCIITVVVVSILSYLLAKNFSKPLEELKIGTNEIQKGNYDYKITCFSNDEFGQVAKAFNSMADRLRKNHDDLQTQTQRLLENNEQLQEINVELEASYEQLQATTAQLNESEEKYRTLIEGTYDLVWLIDREGKLVFINDQIKDMLKYDKKEIIGKHIMELVGIWDNKEKRNNILEKLMEMDYRNVEVVFNTKDGKAITTAANTKRIFNNGEIEAIQGVCRDITERKRMEKEILKRNMELSTINKISKNLNSTMNMKKLLNNIVEDIVELIDIPLCTIRLIEDNKLKLMAYSGALRDVIVFEDIQVNEDVMGKAIITGDVLTIDCSKEKNISKYNEKIVKSKSVDFLTFIPLKVRDKIFGVLNVATKDKLDITSFNILTSVANQMAMVIENISLYQGLKENYMKTIETLAAAVEAKDKYTVGHSLRVSRFGYMIAKHLNLPKEKCEDIKIAGVLHDIGKIGISDGILSKPGRLTEEEYHKIKEHPVIGNKILENVGFSDTIMNAIKYHHKRYDLKGYPEDEKITELSLEACIIGVADALDAMTSDRSYRPALYLETAIEELINNRGTQFHPYIVDLVVQIYKTNRGEIEEIVQMQ